MGKRDIKAGNKCCFLLFQIFNFFSMLGAFGILGIAIYMFVMTADAKSTFNWCFTSISVILFGMTLWACKMRKKPCAIYMYLIFIALLFSFMMVLTVFFFVDVDKLAEVCSTAYAEKLNISVTQARSRETSPGHLHLK